MQLVSQKEYIGISVFWSDEGRRDYNDVIIPDLTPTCLYLEGCGEYVVDRIKQDGLMPGKECGGYGIRYTARTSCEDEENYDKVFYVYFERFGRVGRWRIGDQHVAVDAFWDAHGKIVPTRMHLNDFVYTIGKKGILQMYSMGTRKSDGTGMRYIVKATCRQLRDYNREFSLMLEEGGEPVGRWFCEDADIVEKRKVVYTETDDDVSLREAIDESMGVTHICARYQVTIDMADVLRDWNDKHGIWLSPDAFEKKVQGGEILPTDYAPVFVAGDHRIDTQIMRWGFRRSWTKTPLYNAKCDTVETKNTFRDAARNRCVIPSGGFYEYRREGGKPVQKYLFTAPDTSTLYMAGIYERDGEDYRYTILTTDANSSIDIHDRMPVILRPDECKAWLRGRIGPGDVLDRRSIVLEKKAI